MLCADYDDAEFSERSTDSPIYSLKHDFDDKYGPHGRGSNQWPSPGIQTGQKHKNSLSADFIKEGQ